MQHLYVATNIILIFLPDRKRYVDVVTMESCQQFLVKWEFFPYLTPHKQGKTIKHDHLSKINVMRQVPPMVRDHAIFVHLAIIFHVPRLVLHPSGRCPHLCPASGKSYYATIRLADTGKYPFKPVLRLKFHILMNEEQTRILCSACPFIVNRSNRTLSL